MDEKFSKGSLLQELSLEIDRIGLDVKNLSAVFDLAYQSHQGQFRESSEKKSTRRVPYITHPVGVTKIAVNYFPDANLDDNATDVIHAALLHDVLEDTEATTREILGVSSQRCLDIVLALTKPAVAPRMSRDDRNRIFLENIRSEGKTAAFLKLTDSFHNLSRPQSMPQTLLEKTIRKSKRDYLPLFQQFDMPISLEHDYSDCISQAEAAYNHKLDSLLSISSPQEYLQLCHSRTSGKILEPHDIVDLILAPPGVTLVLEGTVDDMLSLEAIKTSSSRKILNELKSELMAGKPIELPDQMLLKKFPHGMIYPLRMDDLIIEPEERKFLFVSTSKQDGANWVTWELLQSAMALLSERHRNHQSLRVHETAELISSLKLDLSPSLFVRSRLSRSDLRRLKRVWDRANIAENLVQDELRRIVERANIPAENFQIESRIKSPNSAIAKLVKRRFSSIDDLDDIIGLRVVTPSHRYAQKLSTLISDRFEGGGIQLLGKVSGFCKLDMTTSAGYSAIHIGFLVHFNDGSDISISCEIQIRTLLQDAWAKLSHAVMYKKGSKNRKKNAKILKEISQRLHLIDEEIGKLEP